MIEEKNSKKRLKEMESRQKRKKEKFRRTLRVQGLYGTLSFPYFTEGLPLSSTQSWLAQHDHRLLNFQVEIEMFFLRVFT